ncbi:MAG: hypothetical protein Q8R87_09365, partial [Anaerolineaceae bacterium]|nr:hypothetical protein [Anaerolineaceae bacterium]
MAAGLALDPQNFKSFQRELDKTIEQQSEHHPVVNELQIDVWQQPAQIDLSLLQSIDQLAPFGAGNPPIVMAAKKMKLVNATPIGKTKEHMQLLIEDAQGQASKFLWWQSAGLPQPEGLFDLAFTARASTYKGQAQVQLEWLNFRPVETESLTLSSKKRKNIEHLDYRRSSVSNAALSEIISKYQPEVFGEGLETSTIERKTRLELSPSESLIILTLPPSQAILDEIMLKVQPQRVFWFCSQQPENETEMVLKTTAQIIKQGFEQNQFKFILAEIAAALATTQEIVRLTILWMSARGLVTIQEDDAKSISLSQGGIANPSQQENFKKKIQKSMAETQAFRRYAIRSDLSDLVEHS